MLKGTKRNEVCRLSRFYFQRKQGLTDQKEELSTMKGSTINNHNQ